MVSQHDRTMGVWAHKPTPLISLLFSALVGDVPVVVATCGDRMVTRHELERADGPECTSKHRKKLVGTVITKFSEHNENAPTCQIIPKFTRRGLLLSALRPSQ